MAQYVDVSGRPFAIYGSDPVQDARDGDIAKEVYQPFVQVCGQYASVIDCVSAARGVGEQDVY
eukprot:CAMPEP_0197050214 /NCGR_PEP_ID=MMETSP1384-20130603/25160_1 /TAXON_ID=29189 /ORGANISM="Ammonia sp." /LENGTH=62 /DNA_ID=CAMNT_0042482587 /DNA_START=292 /DNA_END=477 /DNA_ORIENTATION=+